MSSISDMTATSRQTPRQPDLITVSPGRRFQAGGERMDPGEQVGGWLVQVEGMLVDDDAGVPDPVRGVPGGALGVDQMPSGKPSATQ
jgi:hypothetical protein